MTEAIDMTTEEDIHSALEAARLLSQEPSAIAAEYVRSLDLIVIKINDGSRLTIPREQLQGLENATPEQLARIEIFGGNDISWPDLDVDHYLPCLLEGKYSTKRWKRARMEHQPVAA